VRSYGAVAWCYDEIAAFYSLGQIGQAKASQVALLEAGECVLYAGVGRGEEALLAAQGGARVTALDSSPAMLARLRRALAREGAQARLVCGDVFDHAPGQPYDVVVANFFLNVFSPDEMRRALRHLVSLVRTGGRVMIADFAPPQGSAAARLVTRVYYRPVSLAAFASRLAALHPIYDYAREFETLGLELIRRDEFRLASWTPVLFESLVARRC
jgi:demethylmenaquinone methyltransferase/2-methoxy-6-polyprenyl-1,4-benzoquinol methylase